MSIQHFVEALSASYARCDPELLVAVLAPGATLWHNNDGIEVDAAASAVGIASLGQLVDGLHLEVDEQRDTDDGGYVRFTVRGTVRSIGTELAARNCVFIRCDADEKVVRMDEYVDPTFEAQLGV